MEMKRANHDNEKSQSVGPNINIKQSTLLVGKRMPAIIRRNIDMFDYAFHTYIAKLPFFSIIKAVSNKIIAKKTSVIIIGRAIC